jgi:hypothetical protein
MTAEGPATKETDDSELFLELLLNSLTATDGLLNDGFEIDGNSIDLDTDGRANDGFSDQLKTLLDSEGYLDEALTELLSLAEYILLDSFNEGIQMDSLLLPVTLMALTTEDVGVAREVTAALLTSDLELDA